MSVVFHQLSHLDMDFEEYVQTKIALTREPMTTDLYEPVCNAEASTVEMKKTVALCLDDFSLFRQRTHVLVGHYAGLCALSAN